MNTRALINIIGLALCTFLSALGASVSNVALPEISAYFSVEHSQVNLVVFLYFFAIISSAPILGWMSDVVGRRNILFSSLFVFAISSLICGISNTINQLYFGRFIQGIGSAGLMVTSVAAVSGVAPKGRLGRYMAIVTMSSAVGTASGPAMSGLILTYMDWRSIYIGLIPIGLVSGIFLFGFPRGSNERHIQIFDYKGSILLILAISALVLSISQVVEVDFIYRVVCLLAFSFLSLAFLSHERFASYPIVPIKVIEQEKLSIFFVSHAVVAVTMMTVLIVGPFYLSEIFRLNNFSIGLIVSISPAISIIFSIPSGFVSDKFGGLRSMQLGVGVIACGCLLLAFLPKYFELSGYILGSMTLPIGHQLFLSGVNTTVLKKRADNSVGALAGSLTLVRQLGFSIGSWLFFIVLDAIKHEYVGDNWGSVLVGIEKAAMVVFLILAGTCLLMLILILRNMYFERKLL